MCVSFGLIFHIKLNTHKGFTQSEPISCRFSFIWAKLIDVACSILIAPGLLALANWYIFKLVRLCAISQGTVGDRPVNLKALTELAGTDWGPIGFNIANVTQKVETLYGPKDDAPSKVISDILDSGQDIELSAQLTRSLHNIPPEIGTTNTSHQVVLNVSSQSLSRVSKSAKRLFNVPAYQLAASCKPADIRSFQVQLDSREENYAEFHIRIKIASKLADFKGRGRNMAPSLKGQSDIGVARPLVAFKDEKIWIGWFYYTKEKDTATYLTDYGPLGTYRYSPEKDDQVLDWTICGVTCELSITMGTATVNRKDWSISKVRLDEQTHRFEECRPLLYSLQNKWEIASPAFYKTPGLGGHLADAASVSGSGIQMSNIHFIVKAFAWLEAKMRDVAYNMAERDSGRNMDVEVMVEGNGEQLYTMTFVSWILLTGLLALGTAGLLAIGLALDFLRTPSLRSGRMLSPVRLMMDVGAVLDKHVLEQALTWDGDELDAWVKTVKFKYEPAEGHGEARVTEDGDYDCCMRLRQISQSNARD
ncbi:hypothetical protein NW757_004284 [Fusarium falciforme]|nr:hypothetical protein NW757_004284 [Fusarium falciforme]